VARWADGDLHSGAADSIGRRLAAVEEVLRSVDLQTPMNSHFELKLDTLRNIQPMELGVMQMCQATVELVSSTDDPLWIQLLHFLVDLYRPTFYQCKSERISIAELQHVRSPNCTSERFMQCALSNWFLATFICVSLPTLVYKFFYKLYGINCLRFHKLLSSKLNILIFRSNFISNYA